MSKTVKLIPFHEGQANIAKDFALNPEIKFGVVSVGRQ